ncbi:MAG: hypothetical protein QXU99_04660 [Candidatus Bathyarchaeia archaeon]
MKGAIVFLAAFLLFLAITLGYQALPPGRQIYDAIIGAQSDYLVGGIPVTRLAISIFNGVIYGFITYVIYWILTSYIFKKEPTVKVKVQTS